MLYAHCDVAHVADMNAVGLTWLELDTLTGPTSQQYDDMLQNMSELRHLHINKVSFCTVIPQRACSLCSARFAMFLLPLHSMYNSAPVNGPHLL